MTESPLDLLVAGLFDYSGMFPPESKTLEGALHDCCRFPQSLKRPFLVNADIVLQRKNIELFDQAVLSAQGFQGGRKVGVSFLGADAVDNEMAAQDEDLSLIDRFNSAFSEAEIPATIISYEMKTRREVDVEALVSMASKLLIRDVLFAIEPDLSCAEWRSNLRSAITAIVEAGKHVSLKIRGTGPTGIDTERMASVIAEVAKAKVSIKSTGGMHHPIIEKERYGNNLGFLNFASAVVFSRIQGSKFSEAAIKECLDCEVASDYSFSNGLSWRNYHVSLDDLKKVKGEFAMSIGSCSLKEPDDDLQRLF